MTLTHELGHIIAGWCSGGSLQAADLIPWHLPYSIFQPDPRPLITLSGGPLLGVLVPLSVAVIVRRNWSWFVSHFCTLANGAYVATAWFSDDRHLDTPRLLAHGASHLSIGLYCLLTIGFGYMGLRRCWLSLLASNFPAGMGRAAPADSSVDGT